MTPLSLSSGKREAWPLLSLSLGLQGGRVLLCLPHRSGEAHRTPPTLPPDLHLLSSSVIPATPPLVTDGTVTAHKAGPWLLCKFALKFKVVSMLSHCFSHTRGRKNPILIYFHRESVTIFLCSANQLFFLLVLLSHNFPWVYLLIFICSIKALFSAKIAPSSRGIGGPAVWTSPSWFAVPSSLLKSQAMLDNLLNLSTLSFPLSKDS